MTAQQLPSCQTPDETSQVPTALRLVRVIRFRLSGWFAHVNLLLLITDSTQVLSTLTRVQSGRLVSSRLTTDITTQTRLKQLRASVGRLVDEAERLLTAWSAHRSHSSIPLAVTHTSGNSVVTLVASDDMDLDARSRLSVFDVQCPEDQNASGPRLKQFRDQDSYLSSDTDENVEELVSVTSRSSVSLESDESDHLVNYDKGVDISWASEMTAHSVAPSDNTSCGLTATLSQHSVQSVTTLGQQHQSEQRHISPHLNPDSNASHHSHGDPQLFIVPDLANFSPKVPVDSSHEDKTDPVMCNLYQNEMTHEEDRILKDTELLILPAQSTTPSDLRSFHSSNASGSDRSLISWYSVPVHYLLRLWRRILEWSIIRPFSSNPTLNKNLEFQSVTDSTSISSRALSWSRFSRNWSVCGPLLRWSDRPWYRDLLIGTIVALLLIAIFPYFVHLLFPFPSSGDAQTTSCVYRWSRLFSWFQDTQEMGPGRTLAKTWPRHAPPF
ncbi:hypothetical protein FGIG_05176 [Fasciola gigantica]|uniref:Uncharacterized protein n=1 Tax=Fasciola gigantica TaxID=46835 RepID=A0A504YNJ5_FASGI|nr:hypothetical protein FGIG_05176 [Fasciola gigantica]